jgi:hypothetical protein
VSLKSSFTADAAAAPLHIGSIRLIARDFVVAPAPHYPAELVMPGLVPGIHVLTVQHKKGVDGRVKPGHDEEKIFFQVGSRGTAC